ncbi:MAG: hypothetical protein CMG25_04420 [Candidatus Marinimicrobia bacterium]|nr:hypothetical protein [Candidatus Neomarinimicrobiota bacterium]|tara:strand:+ start:35451 stop:35819 length:369 start_codon:yes stop_codon:yes gene_type:complete
MKLLKYFLFLMILSSSIYFLIELNELNMLEGDPIKIKIPFMTNEEAFPGGLNVWMVLLITFTLGVVLGFVISLIQMISLKSETITLKSKNKKIQIELDALRNQGLEDELDIPDDLEDNKFSL